MNTHSMVLSKAILMNTHVLSKVIPMTTHVFKQGDSNEYPHF